MKRMSQLNLFSYDVQYECTKENKKIRSSNQKKSKNKLYFSDYRK